MSMLLFSLAVTATNRPNASCVFTRRLRGGEDLPHRISVFITSPGGRKNLGGLRPPPPGNTTVYAEQRDKRSRAEAPLTNGTSDEADYPPRCCPPPDPHHVPGVGHEEVLSHMSRQQVEEDPLVVQLHLLHVIPLFFSLRRSGCSYTAAPPEGGDDLHKTRQAQRVTI